MGSHRGSSLVFLGFSIIIFMVTYGIMWYLVPIVLGSFFQATPAITDPTWAGINSRTQNVLSWLIPLAPTIGIFVFIIKALMSASVRGRD